MIKLSMLVAAADTGTRKKIDGSWRAKAPQTIETQEVVNTPPHEPWEDQAAQEGELEVATEPLNSDIE